MKSRFGTAALALLLIAALLITGCQSTQPSDSTPQEPADTTPQEPADTTPPETTGITLQEMADDVTDGVGEATSVTEGDPEKVVFVFEELHASTLGHLEIGIMLNRLYASYELRHVGLEGHPADAEPLDTSWSHTEPYYQPDQIITAREDVIVQMLADGEINSAEMLGLVYYDAVIHGIDDAELYAVETKFSTWTGSVSQYIYYIALEQMSDTEFTAWRALYDQEQYSEALEFAFSVNETAAELWARWTDSIDLLQDTEMPAFLDLVKEEAEAAGVNIGATNEANVAAFRDYYQNVVIPRSIAMAENMLNVVADYPGAPLAMIIGAAHTSHIEELLTEAGLSVVTVRPLSMAEGNTAGTLSNEAFERKNQGLSVAPEGYLGAFLDGRRNTPPVAEKTWYQLEQKIKQFAQMAIEVASVRWSEGIGPQDVQNDPDVKRMIDDLMASGLVAAAAITSVGMDPDKGVVVGFQILLTNGQLIEGQADKRGGTLSKPQVVFEDCLQQARGTLMQTTDGETTDGENTERVCSGVVVTWDFYRAD